MIVSHKHRYVFIELPLTGSTAIARELVENYDGESVLAKHASYGDLVRHRRHGKELDYFMFSGVRNPIDLVISEYQKYKNDHRGRFSAGRSTKAGRLRKYVTRYREGSRYRYIVRSNATFGRYLRRFYWVPYSSWSILWHARLDYVYRFENLADEFAHVLQLLGLTRVRPLPAANVTAHKKLNIVDYFEDPAAIVRAKLVFGPYMRRWGYDFPAEWSGYREPPWSDPAYAAVNSIRKLYWRYLR
jgi:hypothetical protein